MAFTHELVERVSDGTSLIASTRTFTTEQNLKIEEAVADESTDTEILFAMDVSNLKVFAMIATVAMTVKTNDSETPQETITLTANRAVVFREGAPALFDGDVSALYVSNASGEDGVLKIIAGLDVA